MRLFLIGFVAAFAIYARAAEQVWMDSLDLSLTQQGWGSAQTNKSVTGAPLSISGKVFEHGVGTHAPSTMFVNLAGGTERFLAAVGLDDAANQKGSVIFRLYADGTKVYDSGILKKGAAPKNVNVPLPSVKILLLEVTDAGDGKDNDHANWGDARFVLAAEGAKPRMFSAPPEKAVILTPAPGPQPRINGPTIYGCRPGNPFIYRIPAQGLRPMKFSADGLPRSLQLDPVSGIITGTAPERGTYKVVLKARNSHGTSTRLFRIVSEGTLALTPPMGYNHWYAHYDRVTDKTMRDAADILIASGMADVGYQYVNVDDCWMNAASHKDPVRVGRARDAEGRLLSNKYFPDMAGLADYIHRRGLKAGLYSSPGEFTCAGFHASYGHEAMDARTFAEWGFDFLKYDWCSYGSVAASTNAAEGVPTFAASLERQVRTYPYKLMGDLLKKQNRDIVYNLCQYGADRVWEWGQEVGGHCWRTAGDLGFELDRIFEVALKNSEYRAWSRPGAWNDPDYIQIGWIGNAQGGGLPEPTKMPPNQQYAYMSLWALMASPLFYSGDLSRMDAFTLNVLCNPEVIDVNQDALGQSAALAQLTEASFLMIKDLEDGSKAVGLFNRAEMSQKISLHWAVAGLEGKQAVRDLWRQKDLGIYENSFTAEVPAHGVFLLKIQKPAK